ncbi:hypothetical protein [Nocardia sp. NPDC059239]|uniref:hypothetical protein n=1 Tax=unclassified Nocardia TaxID=2637762 RepID=UPI0036B9B407
MRKLAGSQVAVEDLAVFGPFFAVHTHTLDSTPCDLWYPMRELIDDPQVLIDRVNAVRAHLAAASGQPVAAVEPRVAGSVTQLGLVSRLVSPALAVAVRDRRVLDVDLGSIRWQRVLGGAFPLSVPVAAEGDQDSRPQWLAGGLYHRVVDGVIREIVEATRQFSIPTQILWGNVASAINGATMMIARTHPEHADLALEIATLLLDRPSLSGTSSSPPGQRFRRRSCCLIYRAAPNAAGAVCGDCILV